MKRSFLMIISVLIVLAILFYVFIRFGSSPAMLTGVQDNTIRIVAAENFYGNIAAQLGGDHVSVTSILSDPNVDPHEYESDVQDGVAITNANIVIENGMEYDTWMDKLLSASPSSSRILITASAVASNPLPENPHVWYGIDNVASIARVITNSLEQIDPADTADYEANLTNFNNSLVPITDKMAEIKSLYGGTPVGLTETIYLYQTQPMGLNVLTPLTFERAIAEGNDPSAQDVNIANSQIATRQIKVLIFNSQTVTPITSNLQAAAEQNNILIVPVSETMPPNDTYQSWMMDELNTLQAALAQATGH
jgi:zinc/manganese transport system substrate-binding protein